ncbi:MAG: alpha-2-macroglobulin family protein, partial [Verrucomicrobiales bacterium]
MGRDGEAHFFLPLDPSWKHGHTLEIQASIIDANQREQRTSKVIPLGSKADPDFELTLGQTEVRPGDPIAVSINCADGKTVSLLAFKLKPEIDWNDGAPMAGNPFLSSVGSFSRSAIHLRQQWVPAQPTQRIAREFHSISVLKKGKVDGGKASYETNLRIGKPGAYVVRALAQDANGQEMAVERTVVVLPSERANGVFLKLESDRFAAGKPLRGTVRSRFDGAVILLALRDGNGVRALRPVTIKKGAADFEIPLPKDLTVGCELTARYTDDGHALHFHRRPFAVEPEVSHLNISSTIPESVEPGTEVEMEFSVDRKEVTDLVVSVYDQSLLGIAPDPGIDGPSLFYADTRVEDDVAERMLRSYFGNLSMNQLKEGLRTYLDEKDSKNQSSDLILQQLRALHQSINRKQLDAFQLPVLLAWLGVPLDLETLLRNLQFRGRYGAWRLDGLGDEEMDGPITNLLNRTSLYQTRLVFSVVGETLDVRVEQIQGNQRDLLSETMGGSGSFFGGFRRGNLGVGIPLRGRARVIIPLSGPSPAMFGDLGSSGNASVSGQSFHSHLAAMPPATVMPLQNPDAPGGQQAAGPALKVRRDFSDSAFFNAKVRTDASGKATVKFKLPDSLTNWRVVVTGVSQDLAIGRHTASFRTYQPVMV